MVAQHHRALQPIQPFAGKGCLPFGGTYLATNVGQYVRRQQRPARYRSAGIGAREEEQLRDHSRHAVRFYPHVGQGPRLKIWVALSNLPDHIQRREHDRQRRAQLVRHVGQKLALQVVEGLDLAVGLLQGLQHPVDGRGEASDLVGRARTH